MEALVSAKQFRNVCQIHTDIHVLQGGTSDSVIAVWLICCLNCYQFSWPNCSFLFLHVHILLIMTFEPTFCDKGEAWETKVYKEDR